MTLGTLPSGGVLFLRRWAGRGCHGPSLMPRMGGTSAGYYSTVPPAADCPALTDDRDLSLSPRVAQLRRAVEALNPADRRLLVRHLQKNFLADPTPPTGSASASSSFSSPVLPLDVPDVPDVPAVPPFRTILVYSVHQALPFVGFGFLDNLIMILAGEYIDHTLGVTLSISTMAAAGLGNAISDAFGVGSAWYVEHWIARFGFYHPHLSLEERALTRVRMGANLGKALGVTVGCLIGMLPLAFM